MPKQVKRRKDTADKQSPPPAERPLLRVEAPESSSRSSSLFGAQIASVWCALILLEAAAHYLLAASRLRHDGIPPGARIALLCYDLTVFTALFAVICAGMILANRSMKIVFPGWLFEDGVIARRCLVTASGFVLLLYSASWAKFWHTGSFLSHVDFAFVSSHPVQIFHWIGADVIMIVLPASLVTAVLISRITPHWITRWMPQARQRLIFASAAFSGLFILGAIVGELYSNLGERQWTRSGIVYAKNRDQTTGPPAYVVAGIRQLFNGPAENLGAGDSMQIIQRPVISMEHYLAGIGGRRENRLNVILIMVESLGANQLRPYGAGRTVMPTVEELARDGRVFSNTYTQASHTDYATLVPLSSHYPLRSTTVQEYPKNPSYPRVLIYDVLKAIGYRTAIFSSSNEYWGGMINYLQTSNLDRVFHAATFKGPTYVMEADTGFASWVRETKHAGSIDDRYTVAEAMEWIDAVNNEPFFVYLNLQNSHLPYVIPSDFPRRFSPKEIGFTIRFGNIPRDKIEIAKDVYADSLAYVDSQIARLVDHLRRRGLWDKTVIIVTGDHGQAFYEHGFSAHAGEIYNEVMKVPLIIRAPSLQPAIDQRLAQHADVAPSILDILGLPGHPSFQGESLLKADANSNRSVYLVAQSPLAHQIGIVRGRHKLIYDVWHKQYLLYDLTADRAESHNLAYQQSPLLEALAKRLQTWRRLQLDYYADKTLHSREYPPILAD